MRGQYIELMPEDIELLINSLKYSMNRVGYENSEEHLYQKHEDLIKYLEKFKKG